MCVASVRVPSKLYKPADRILSTGDADATGQVFLSYPGLERVVAVPDGRGHTYRRSCCWGRALNP